MATKKNNKGHILVRYAIVVGIMLLFSITIIWSMFKFTVVQAQAWNDKANTVLDSITLIQPDRGKLLADKLEDWDRD